MARKTKLPRATNADSHARYVSVEIRVNAAQLQHRLVRADAALAGALEIASTIACGDVRLRQLRQLVALGIDAVAEAINHGTEVAAFIEGERES